MGRATASTEFARLEPHDQAARRARVLFVVAHRWFERDAVARHGATNQLARTLTTVAPMEMGGPPLVKWWARSSDRGLVERAEIAINLAGGDQELRARFERAAHG